MCKENDIIVLGEEAEELSPSTTMRSIIAKCSQETFYIIRRKGFRNTSLQSSTFHTHSLSFPLSFFLSLFFPSSFSLLIDSLDNISAHVEKGNLVFEEKDSKGKAVEEKDVHKVKGGTVDALINYMLSMWYDPLPLPLPLPPPSSLFLSPL